MGSYFTDPLHASSLWGVILMCFSSSVIGVIAFLRKESLIGETLSHAALPGVVIGIIVGSLLFSSSETAYFLCQIFCSLLFACLGIVVLHFMKHSLKIKEDASLCFVLSTFVGCGLFVASILQEIHPLWYRQVQLFFYGQAATLREVHAEIYAIFAVVVTLFLFLVFPRLRISLFDKEYGRSLGIALKKIDTVIFILISLAIVIGIKAVGVVLMSGMLIAPAIVARAFSAKLKNVFIIAAAVGVVSGTVGHILSYEIPLWFSPKGAALFKLPTGPLILLVAVFFSFSALLLAPGRGVIYKWARHHLFKWKIREENFIKAFWKSGLHDSYSDESIRKQMGLSRFTSFFLLLDLKRKGKIVRLKEGWELTKKGKQKAQQIVRLHRLFELYLSLHLNVKETDVHNIAEEMEHYITPKMEKELTELLRDPKADPHQQPIPERFTTPTD